MSIDYINHEVSLKIISEIESQDSEKDLIGELKEESHVHPNILLYLFVILLVIGLICATVFIVKNRNNISPYENYMNRRQLHQVPLQQINQNTKT